MTDLNKGDVKITLAGEERILRRTLRAYDQIAAMGTTDEIVLKALGGDVGVISRTLRWGLGMTDADAKKLREMLFDTPMNELRLPVYEYLHRLFHSGMSAEEVAAVEKAGGSGKEPADS